MSLSLKLRRLILFPILFGISLLIMDGCATYKELTQGVPYNTYNKGTKLADVQVRVRQNPNDAEAHLYLGVAYYDLGQYKEAVASYKEAIRIKPDYANAHFIPCTKRVKFNMGTGLQ